MVDFRTESLKALLFVQVSQVEGTAKLQRAQV
jgi:hypothetical protein